ncbi:MAG: cytidine deaminase [Chloroflexi bacterium]|nr:cytidine deaminase [Chloroflexota bacterium]
MSDNHTANDLMVQARQAARYAHAPYSRFRVGAAAEAGDQVFVGCNVENASYGLTVCAERVAIFAAVAAGQRRVKRLAVACVDAPSDAPASLRMPCGACRQVMAEFMAPDAEILVDGVGAFTVAALLPDAFTLDRD